ncbi:MAG: hypothetical protein H6636_05625 [Anaerolineales bacterium]|nr:hypothetical protein [Anaerolineales bacterium]
MSRSIVRSVGLCLLVGVFFLIRQAGAQTPEMTLKSGEPTPSSPEIEVPWPEPETPASTGGPDEFGYTWDDTVPVNWIDASGGVNTGILTNRDYTGLVDIGFPFRFYENTYMQLYISFYGRVSFSDENMLNDWDVTPSIRKPNDVIAPRWSPANYVEGYVRYLQGGTAPYRWFVVEWNRIIRVVDGNLLGDYTYEMILHENGDIVFQYGSMNGTMCQPSGIENSTGTDGLGITENCGNISSNHAVHIYRPAPAARLKLFNLDQGGFTGSGQVKTYPLVVRNLGDVGADTFDLTVSSIWPVTLFGPSGNLLTDTDSDGLIDTGPVPEETSIQITVQVKAPIAANVGEHDQATVVINSSLDPSQVVTGTLKTAIPAPFAQAFIDFTDPAMRLELVQPQMQHTIKLVDNESQYGLNTALAKTSGFLYTWTVEDTNEENSQFWSNIKYTVLDDQGNTIKPVTTLTDNSNTSLFLISDFPTVSESPNGKIAIVWDRLILIEGKITNDIYYAILDDSGNILIPETYLANVYTRDSGFVFQPFYPQVISTDDDHFFIRWNTLQWVEGSFYYDVFTSIIDSEGNLIQEPVNRTNNSSGISTSSHSSITPMNGNQVLLAYSKNEDVGYMVLDSNGNIVTQEKILSTGDLSGSIDATRLSDGRVLIAWISHTEDYSLQPEFVILDSTASNTLHGPIRLAPILHDEYENQNGLFVVPDSGGNAVFTWINGNSQDRVFYALVNSHGTVLTQPLTFLQTKLNFPGDLWINSNVKSLAPYASPPSSAGVDMQLQALSLAGGAPDGKASFPLEFSNQGALTATEVVVSVTLPVSVTYLSDTSGMVPSVNGNTLAWHFPDLAFLGHGAFTVRVGLPTGEIGTTYPVTVEISATQADDNPADNVITTQLMLANQHFIPVMIR